MEPWKTLVKNGEKPAAEMDQHYKSLVAGFKYFLFSPLLGEDSHFDDHIFQRGWNHQLDPVCYLSIASYNPTNGLPKKLPVHGLKWDRPYPIPSQGTICIFTDPWMVGF